MNDGQDDRPVSKMLWLIEGLSSGKRQARQKAERTVFLRVSSVNEMIVSGDSNGGAENARLENAGVAIKCRQFNIQRFDRRLPAILR